MSLGLTNPVDIGAVWDLVTSHSHLMNSASFFFFPFPVSCLLSGERTRVGKVENRRCCLVE